MLVAGIDEAGRGAWAGPVYAAAVILDPKQTYPYLKDSKLLSAKLRILYAEKIKLEALDYAIASASLAEILNLNILQASLLAMQRAKAALNFKPNLILVDGNICPEFKEPSLAIVKGDNLEPAISAASILAKVARDQYMQALDSSYPEYGFAKHKGYGTKAHFIALETHGVSAVHRLGFAPMKDL